MRAPAVLLGTLLSLPAFIASAQSARPFEISAYGGYRFGAEVFDTAAADASLRLLDAPSYGLRLGYLFSNGLEPELEWTGTDTQARKSFAIPTALVNTRTDDFLGGIAFNISSGTLRPYAGVAAGVTRFGFDSGSRARFTGRLALGLKAFLTPWLAARIEAAGYATHAGDDLFPCTTFSDGGNGGPVVPVSCSKTWLLQGNLGGGLVFAF
jgi:hypothetical protein